jgi:hypothetical protein
MFVSDIAARCVKTSAGDDTPRSPVPRHIVWRGSLFVALVLFLAGCTPGGLSSAQQTAVAVENAATATARAQTPGQTNRLGALGTPTTASLPVTVSPSATPPAASTSTPVVTSTPAQQGTRPPSAAATATVATTPTVSTREIRYTDPEQRFSFNIPDDWQKQQTQVPGIAVQFVSDRLHGDVNIVTEGAPNVTLDQYVTATIASVRKNYPDLAFDTKSMQAATVGGKAAQRYGFSGDAQQRQIRLIQFVVINSDVAYVITFTAATQDGDTFMDQMNRIIQTFAFIAPAPTPGP